MRDHVSAAPEQADTQDSYTKNALHLTPHSGPLAADTHVSMPPAAPPRRGLRSLLHGPEGDITLGAGWLDAIGLAEGGLLADVGVVLDLASIYLPVIGTVFSPAVPTPFAMLMLRRGPRVTLLASAVATFLITILAGPHFGWRMGLQALVGLLLGWAMRRRLNQMTILCLGTLLVATVTFCAALGVIFVVGLPIKDIVSELRNGLGALAWALASGASLFGYQAQWLAVRPALVAAGLLALRFWPALLYISVLIGALPVVTLYYAVASATARVLGQDVRPFPPLWSLRLLRIVTLIVLAPILLPARGVRRLRGRRKQRGSASDISIAGEDDDL